MEKDKFSSELLLKINNFNEQEVNKGLEAFARVCQNIIIHEKGCYPNQPQLGVGIGNYEFEILDQITKMNLQSEIKEQVSHFAPNNINLDVYIDDMMTKTNHVVLCIMFYITRDGLAKTSPKQVKEDTFALVVNRNKKSGKLISHILF